ncbi:GNAT family N-acetyltransferase [Sandaracinobacteroides saxicola]|uniref:N-acetyltransferase n=1 Tax=Sandaracinobacteroides saxicola TaxID=2759707 RepID=A0A7G5IG30_9SPHN|nr:GNAT family N-acetyltransferase [Sandaracinobacteroides saxicola]QMW22322.1 N-acetyltransferase [Sandaracinobacteroides saxicola]
MSEGEIIARILHRAGDIAAADWDACAGRANPFAAHAFVTALEDSGSVSARAGWQPVHLVVDGAAGRPAAILPGYLKSHSQGEYVFDHSWADAWARAGQSYYPKLQHSSPFTPATGPRLLGDPALAPVLIAASEALVRQNGFSGAHATFLTPDDRARFEAAGWMPRHDVQYHWFNEGFAGFDDFLAALASRKRKVLKRERAEALAAVDGIDWLTGADLTEAAWDAFWAFYQDTGSRKWGRPYLTRNFFSLLSERMADRVLLVMARKAGRWVAGALNFIGEDALYGRNWGCSEDIPFLHFEVCYHQAIDFAAQRGLARVEAGAQGQHKLARGYRPVATTSAHFISDLRFRAAVADFLTRERPAVLGEAEALEAYLPFRAM